MATRTKPSSDSELQVEQWPVAKLLRYANNSRDHSDAQIAQIAASIKEFGFVNPCLIDANGVLIAGHGRIAGAQKLGLEVVPVIKLGHLTETQARALRIADNAIALNSTWNLPAIKIELDALKLADYPMELVGFDNLQLVQFMAGVPTGKDPEATPEPPATPVSRRGDIWVLGAHRLMCGDAYEDGALDRLMDGAQPGLVLTDPPYGLGRKMRGGTWGAKQKYADMREWDSAPPDDFLGQLRTWPCILWGGNYFSLPASRCWLLWVKSTSLETMADFEMAWTSFDLPAKMFVAARSHTSAEAHPTQKPVDVFRWCLEFQDGPVLDPFAGSFTTAIACEGLGRSAFGIEANPSYCDMSVLRWQEFSGKDARHQETGMTFDEMKKGARKPPRRRAVAKKAA